MNYPQLWRKRHEPARADANPFTALQREVNDLFDSMFERTGDEAWPAPRAFARDEGALAPSVDISETAESFDIKAELPGLDEKDIRVTLDGDALVLSGEKKQEREEKEKNYHLVECSYGSFQRTIPLPSGLDRDKVKATFKKGVLNIRVPKLPEAQAAGKQVEIEGE